VIDMNEHALRYYEYRTASYRPELLRRIASPRWASFRFDDAANQRGSPAGKASRDCLPVFAYFHTSGRRQF
jgi:hypothetical protein